MGKIKDILIKMDELHPRDKEYPKVKKLYDRLINSKSESSDKLFRIVITNHASGIRKYKNYTNEIKAVSIKQAESQLIYSYARDYQLDHNLPGTIPKIIKDLKNDKNNFKFTIEQVN